LQEKPKDDRQRPLFGELENRRDANEKNEQQRNRFIETARALECDEARIIAAVSAATICGGTFMLSLHLC
jgi:hypothetical protein